MKKVLGWVFARAKEPTTYMGLAVIAGAVGAPEVGVVVGKVGTGLAMVLGGGMIAHPSSPPE